MNPVSYSHSHLPDSALNQFAVDTVVRQGQEFLDRHGRRIISDGEVDDSAIEVLEPRDSEIGLAPMIIHGRLDSQSYRNIFRLGICVEPLDPQLAAHA